MIFDIELELVLDIRLDDYLDTYKLYLIRGIFRGTKFAPSFNSVRVLVLMISVLEPGAKQALSWAMAKSSRAAANITEDVQDSSSLLPNYFKALVFL